jgi:hypothetical protein
MKLSQIALSSALTIASIAVACKGTSSLTVEAPGIKVEGKWERNDDEDPETEGDEYKYTVSGEKLELIRGEEFKAVFLDADGAKVGETTGTVPTEGDLVITGPESAVDLDWATGEDIQSLSSHAPPVAFRAAPRKAYQVVGTRLRPDSGPAVEYSLTLTSSGLGAALDRARTIANTAPLTTKPQDVVCHYMIKAIPVGQVVDLVSITNAAQPALWVDVNRSWVNTSSTDVSQMGWNVRAVQVPSDAFAVPTRPGLEVSNSVRIVSGSIDLTLGSSWTF